MVSPPKSGYLKVSNGKFNAQTLFLFTSGDDKLNEPVSQSCAVATNEQIWRAAGQSNVAYERLAGTKASKVWFSYAHNCAMANGAVFHSVCQV